MRAVILYALLTAVNAATTKDDTTLITEVIGSKTTTITYTYSNPATILLTETNSAGSITGTLISTEGEPSLVTSQPSLITSQPHVASIPAGLPTGETTLFYNGTSTLRSFVVSVGKSTTKVLSGATGTGTSVSSGMTGGPHHHGSTGTAAASGSSSTSPSASSTSTGGAEPTGHVASAGMVGIALFFAALL